jgi:8-oxo-dGTP diphosphatase
MISKPNKFTECTSLYGEKVSIPTEKLTFRIAGYGIVIQNGQILIATGKNTGKYWFPGGGVDLGEKITDAVRREIMEETGIEVEIKKELASEEIFFYYNPQDLAFHQYSIFFQCKPLSMEVGPEDQLDSEEETEKPHWVDIKKLKKEDFHPGAEKVLNHILDVGVKLFKE